MHVEVMDFANRMRTRFPAAFRRVDVLEFGSYNINGSLKDGAKANSWVGVDWRSGPGVDKVALAHEYKGEMVDLVVCTEMLEHDPYFTDSIRNMVRHVAPGGSLLITAAGTGRNPHEIETSPEKGHYQNLTLQDLVDDICDDGWQNIVIESDQTVHDVRMFCFKRIG